MNNKTFEAAVEDVFNTLFNQMGENANGFGDCFDKAQRRVIELYRARVEKPQTFATNPYSLIEFQHHPLTCCSGGPADKCERRLNVSEGELIDTEEGLVCPCGHYKQSPKKRPFNRRRKVFYSSR